MMVLFLLSISEAYQLAFIVDQSGNKYASQIWTDIGFIPYGESITGQLTSVDDLCQPQKNQIVFASITTKCSVQQQATNAQGSQVAILYSGDEQFKRPKNIGKQTAALMILTSEVGKQLEKVRQSNITVHFPINKDTIPNLYYIIYTHDQSTESLKQIKDFRSKLDFSFYPIIITDDVCDNTFEKEDSLSQIMCAEIGIFWVKGMHKWLNYRIRFVEECSRLITLEGISNCQLNLMSEQSILPEELLKFKLLYPPTEILSIVEESIRQSDMGAVGLDQGLIIINNQPLQGNYSVTKQIHNSTQSLLFNALCQSFLDTTPAICQQSIIEQVSEKIQISGKISILIISSIIVLLLFTVLALVYLQRREQIKKQQSYKAI